MKNLILTLIVALVSQFSFAQNTKDFYESMKQVSGTESVKFPSFILKIMNKGTKNKSKIKKMRMVINETNVPEFCKQLELETQKLLDNGYELVERPTKDGNTQQCYLLGDAKVVKEFVTIHKKGNATYPMIHITEGTFDRSQFTTDMLDSPEINAEFLKKVDELAEELLTEYAPKLIEEMSE